MSLSYVQSIWTMVRIQGDRSFIFSPCIFSFYHSLSYYFLFLVLFSSLDSFYTFFLIWCVVIVLWLLYLLRLCFSSFLLVFYRLYRRLVFVPGCVVLVRCVRLVLRVRLRSTLALLVNVMTVSIIVIANVLLNRIYMSTIVNGTRISVPPIIIPTLLNLIIIH